jgi:hypothetical protein
MILVFLNENKHKVNFNIKNFEMFFSLMINVTMFFEFSIKILPFIFLIYI